MKNIKTFEDFGNSLNESTIKVPAKIKNVDELDQYFWPYEANKAKEIWGKNSTISLPAKNDKVYRITYVFKDFHNKYLKLQLVKR